MPLPSDESGSTRIVSSHTKDGENETSEMWRNSLFPVGILFSQVELGERQPGARCLRQVSAEWRHFPFGTKVGALSQAVPWKLLHEPVSSQPLSVTCLISPQSVGFWSQASSSIAYKISTRRGGRVESVVNHNCSDIFTKSVNERGPSSWFIHSQNARTTLSVGSLLLGIDLCVAACWLPGKSWQARLVT